MSADYVVDFSEIEDPKPLDPNTYEGTISKVAPGESKSGHPKLTIEWMIPEEANGDNVPKVFDTLSFHPKAINITKQRLVAMGLPKTFKGSLLDIAEELEGFEANIVVDIQISDQTDPSTGELYPPRNIIKKVMRLH